MVQIGSKVLGLSPLQRVLILIHIITDFCMPRMINMEPYIPFRQRLAYDGSTRSASPGYSKVHALLQLHSTVCSQGSRGSLVPWSSFFTWIDQMFASNPMESTDHPIKTTRGVLESGRIWRMDFTEVAMRYEPPGSRGSPLQMLDPHYNFLDTLSPEQKCYYLPCATLGSRNH